MGIGGHMLGEKSLRRLNRLTGLDLDRAYIRGNHSEGVAYTGTTCVHYEINPKTGAWIVESDPIHWASCPKED